MSKTVTHLCFSSSGGAGKVANQLREAQKELGWNAGLVTASATDLRSAPLEHPGVTLAAAIDDFVIKEPGFQALYSDLRDRRAVLAPKLPDSDIVHLHWVNGLLDLSKVAQLRNKRVVWTLHDMNPFTGGCHYSIECERFNSGCTNCPAVRSFFSARPPATLIRKKALYAKWPTLQIVAPSAWLASQARDSEAFHDLPISVINNPLDARFFNVGEARSRDSLSIPKEHTVLVLIAAQLDSPIKGVAWAVAAFQAARRTRDDLSLVLVGSGGAEHQNTPGVTMTGLLDVDGIIRVLDRADAIIIPSLAENSPSVAYEAASRGVWPIVRNTPGLLEVIQKLGVGQVCDSSEELATLLSDDKIVTRMPAGNRKKLQKVARGLTGASEVANSYVELYEAME